MDNKDRFKRGSLVTALVVFALVGVIATSGALNYAHETGKHLFTVAGVLNLGNVLYAGVAFYRKFLKDGKLD